MTGTVNRSTESRLWHRVADLRPQVRAGVQVSRQINRGDAWYLLQDPTSGRAQRLNQTAHRIVSLFDGERTLRAIWQLLMNPQLSGLPADAMPTQDELIRLISQLVQANLVSCPMPQELEAWSSATEQNKRRRFFAAMNPLSMKLPIWDPNAFLTRSLAWVRPLGHPVVLAVLGLFVLFGIVQAIAHMETLSRALSVRSTAPTFWLAIWLVYPVLKLLHELAHGWVVKAHGGEVHEIGVSIMLMTPVPYVDASASATFQRRRDRMAVAVAGIVVEAVAASMAAALWPWLRGGMFEDVLLAVILTGGLASVLVNSNPLLRFDGYYALTDLLSLPNLAQRSNAYWAWLAKKLSTGLSDGPSPAHAASERKWLLSYGAASWLYRCGLWATIVSWAAHYSAMIAAGLAVIGLAMLVLGPWWKALTWMLRSPGLIGRRGRVIPGVLIASVAPVVALAWPVPWTTVAPGLVWLPDQAIVRTETGGLVLKVLVDDGAHVNPGDVLLQLEAPELQADILAKEAELLGLVTERQQRRQDDVVRSQQIDDQIDRVTAERDVLKRKLDQLQLRAPIGGIVAFSRPADLPGRYLDKGDAAAWIFEPPNGAAAGDQATPSVAPAAKAAAAKAEPPGTLVRAYVSGTDAAWLQKHVKAVRVASSDMRYQPMPARLHGGTPASIGMLPTAALGEKGGGALRVDASDPDGRRTAEPVFAFDLKVDFTADGRRWEPRAGERAWVAFEHGQAPMAQQLAWTARRLWLRWQES